MIAIVLSVGVERASPSPFLVAYAGRDTVAASVRLLPAIRG
jgi:hypothetical protein